MSYTGLDSRSEPRPSTSPRAGHIVSVAGAQAIAVMEKTGAGHVRIEIGSTLAIPTPHALVIGIVSAVSVPMPDAASGAEEVHLLELNLAGEIVLDPVKGRVFRRGVSCLPTIGDPVHPADRDAVSLAYTRPDAETIEVGTLYQHPDVSARLLVDDLIGKHFLVVGTTGCGKSTALTCILKSLLPQYRQARIVVLDIHGEYAAAFGAQAEVINPSNLNLPFWLLNFHELTAAFATPGDEAEIEILTDAVVWAKRRYSDAFAGRVRRSQSETTCITVDTPVPFRLADLVAYCDEQLGKLDRALHTLPYKRLKNRIETLVSDSRYSFMFGSVMIEDTMTDVLGRLFRVPVGDKPITVLDLSTVPGEIMDVVISVISRLAFDLASWSEARLPLMIVCEEAHRYAPAEGGGKFMPTRQALARIAKEGRKYGVALALITQRPSELDTTILSQCSTVIAMRLSTERDQAVIRANTHEGALDLLDFLPLLGDREAIVLGQGSVMPMRIRFKDMHTARSAHVQQASFSHAWRTVDISREELAQIVRRWRSPAAKKGM
jgi:energy-coupling factor transporter ATP-binding protein EcfA2